MSAALTLADVSGSSDFLTKLIEKSFTMDDLKCFSYIESVDLNPVYQFASKIFDDNEAFLKQSVNMATYLCSVLELTVSSIITSFYLLFPSLISLKKHRTWFSLLSLFQPRA